MAEVTIQTNVRKNLAVSGIIGLFVGVSSWLLNIFLQNSVVEPLFCQTPDSFTVCQNGGTISLVTALIVASIIGLLALVKTGFFRPLLIVLCAAIALAGMNAWLGGLAWWEAALWHGLIFALGYMLFAWLATMRSFLFAGLASLGAIIVIRVLIALL